MRVFLSRYGIYLSKFTVHKYMNKMPKQFINWYNYVRPHTHNSNLTPRELRFS